MKAETEQTDHNHADASNKILQSMLQTIESQVDLVI